MAITSSSIPGFKLGNCLFAIASVLGTARLTYELPIIPRTAYDDHLRVN